MNVFIRHIKVLLTAALTVVAIAATVATEAQPVDHADHADPTPPTKLEMIRKAVVASQGLF